MLEIGSRKITYLYTYIDGYREFKILEKVICKLKNGEIIAGFIERIGTKYLTLKTGSTIIHGSMSGGTYSETPTRTLIIDDIVKIYKYPNQSQKYEDKYLK